MRKMKLNEKIVRIKQVMGLYDDKNQIQESIDPSKFDLEDQMIYKSKTYEYIKKRYVIKYVSVWDTQYGEKSGLRLIDTTNEENDYSINNFNLRKTTDYVVEYQIYDNLSEEMKKENLKIYNKVCGQFLNCYQTNENKIKNIARKALTIHILIESK